MIRTRFAPSPTGFQHIGGFRTAMYAWLFARKHGGKFLLRIEDTDQARRVPGAIRYLFESLAWLGIDIDEGPSLAELRSVNEVWDGAPDIGGPFGPYIQSQRAELYRNAAEELIAKGAAYRCDCTPEMLERERNEQLARKETPGYSGYCRTRNVSKDSKHVVRFRMPAAHSLTLQDAVRGRISWDSASLKDPVLFKSDGLPLYHLASVVDDHHMQISHVMRSEEWLPTTPLHLLLYEAFGWDKPIFCHLSQVLGPDGKKLSKRHGAIPVNVYREQGYLGEALLNYVVLVGWNPGKGDEQEIFSHAELIDKFSLEHLGSSGGVFDANKLLWMNGVYLRNLSSERFTELALPFIEQAGLKILPERWNIIAPFVRERMKLLPEVVPMIEFLCVDKIKRDTSQIFKKDMTPEKAVLVLERAHSAFNELKDFTFEETEKALRKAVEELGLKVGPAFGVIRVAVTGKMVTPPLFESIVALGRPDTLKRLQEMISELRSQAA